MRNWQMTQTSFAFLEPQQQVSETPKCERFVIPLAQFLLLYPEYKLVCGIPVVRQPRVYDCLTLESLPVELEPEHISKNVDGGRGVSRWNYNNTRTHYQCKICRRVRRNDFYYSALSQQNRNVVNPTCKECLVQTHANRYAGRGNILRNRRAVIWELLAPRCSRCGFDEHTAVIDFHHTKDKTALVSKLIAHLATKPSIGNAEMVIEEVNKCVPLCSNCHRLVHAGVVDISKMAPQACCSAMDLMRATERMGRA